MYPPQYNLPPINPAAFGGLPQEAPQGGPQGAPQGGPPPPQGGEAPMDMDQYLIDKVMEIKSRMGGGEGMGALSAISNAMTQGQPQGGPPPPQQAPPPPPQPMRA
jgi:hypothetical protein